MILISKGQSANSSAVTASQMFNTNGTLCIKADSELGLQQIIRGQRIRGYRCVQTYNGSANGQLLRIANYYIDVSSLSGITTKSYGLSSYTGQPCYYISGSGTMQVNSTLVDVNTSAQAPVNLDFSTCLSAQYNIPLDLSMNMTAANGSTIKVILNETSLNQTATAYQVESLP